MKLFPNPVGSTARTCFTATRCSSFSLLEKPKLSKLSGQRFFKIIIKRPTVSHDNYLRLNQTCYVKTDEDQVR